MDEEFVGWGGEDTEFWDRCQTLRVANHTYMPIVHLWHPSQPGKAAYRNGSGFGTHTGALYERQMAIPRCERIAALQRRLKP
jgi:predicted glycosyltransferase involved in capsule biosynthesis